MSATHYRRRGPGEGNISAQFHPVDPATFDTAQVETDQEGIYEVVEQQESDPCEDQQPNRVVRQMDASQQELFKSDQTNGQEHSEKSRFQSKLYPAAGKLFDVVFDDPVIAKEECIGDHSQLVGDDGKSQEHGTRVEEHAAFDTGFQYHHRCEQRTDGKQGQFDSRDDRTTK